MQGASAVEEILNKNQNARIQVFVVWEPILPTDWSKPTTIVLKRLSDRRVMQFWDRDHVLAARMAKDSRDPQPTQSCCKRNGHLWDLAAVYGVGASWEQFMPAAVVFDGPVVEIKEKIIAALAFKE